MELNKKRLWQLLAEAAKGNFRELSRLLGVQVSQLHKILNTQSKAGPVFLGKLHTYCKENSLPFEEFILAPAEERTVTT
jgi:predicted transcriptional regulator